MYRVVVEHPYDPEKVFYQDFDVGDEDEALIEAKLSWAAVVANFEQMVQKKAPPINILKIYELE